MILPWLEFGGADHFHLNLAKGLVCRGWSVTIATTQESMNVWLPYFSRVVPDIALLSSFLGPKEYPSFLGHLIQTRSVDAVFLSSTRIGYSLLPYLRSAFPTLPIVDYCHMEEHWQLGGYPGLSLTHDQLTDMTAVTSAHLRDWMTRRGGDAQRISVVPIGINHDVWRPDADARAQVRRELNVADDIPLLLYAGRIEMQKQPDVMAQTVLRLRRAGLRFVVAVAGDGRELPWLRAFVASRKLQDVVRFLGVVPLERMPGLTAASDVLFLPSRYEGIALTIYEAMACGVAVVSADVGGQRELVTPGCGKLVVPGPLHAEAERYTAALSQLLFHADERQAMGEAGRERVASHFRLEGTISAMAALLAEAAIRRAAHPFDLGHARPATSGGLQPLDAGQSPARAAAGRPNMRVYKRISRGARQAPPIFRRPLKTFLKMLVWGVSPQPPLAWLARLLSAILPARVKDALREVWMAEETAEGND
jgi:glycosyltransferase involved in cell wall biosynthesis